MRILAVALLVSESAAFNVPKVTRVEAALHATREDTFAIDRRSAISGVCGASLSMALPWDENAAATPTTRTVPTWAFDNGATFPTLALNTVGLSIEDTERAIGLAVQEGLTHVDFHPGKERDGVALYLKNNPDSNLFLNTKIRKPPPGTSARDAAKRVQKQIEEDFKALGVTSVGMLMLRDSPDCEVMQAQWKILEEAKKSGKCKSLGVINYCQKSLSCLLETAKVKPDIHYFMLHVGMGTDPRGLRSFGESRGIRTFAYGAVGEPGPNIELIQSPVLVKVGNAHGNKSPEEVALRWVLQSGAACSVRPTTEFELGTSVCREGCINGLKRRAETLDWSLTAKEMEQLNSIKSPDDNPTLFSSSGCPGAFEMPQLSQAVTTR